MIEKIVINNYTQIQERKRKMLTYSLKTHLKIPKMEFLHWKFTLKQLMQED